MRWLWYRGPEGEVGTTSDHPRRWHMRHPLRELLHWVSYGHKPNYKRRTWGLYFSDGDWLLKLKLGRWAIGWAYRNMRQINGPGPGWGSMSRTGAPTHELHMGGRRWRITFEMPVKLAKRLGAGDWIG